MLLNDSNCVFCSDLRLRVFLVFENRERIVMVMEYASGGELYEYVQERQRLSEQEARHFFRQITSAVHYCHEVNIHMTFTFGSNNMI